MTFARIIRYRDVIDRELYRKRQLRDANARLARNTDKSGSAEIATKFVGSLDNQIAHLEQERATAPERPREAARFRKSIGVFESVGIRYSIKPAVAMQAEADPALDIPAFLRRT